MSKLYSESASIFVLGSLCNDTSLLNEKHPLTKQDFKANLFDSIVFVVIKTLASKGSKELQAEDFVEFLEAYPSQKEVFADNDGVNFINTIKEMHKEETYDVYYEIVRKFSVLNLYKENGFPIEKFYNEDLEESEAMGEFNKYTLKDILDYYDSIQAKVRLDFNVTEDIEQMVCGDEFDVLLDELQEEPMIGAGLTSGYLNALYRGWCKGHLNLRGASSSMGKTALGIAELVNTSCKKIWSDEYKDFIDNPCYQGIGAYIHTEQKSREEIQTRFISNIANIPYNILLDGAFDDEQKARLSEAGKIVKDSELRIINYPTFTASGITLLCKDLALNYGTEYLNFDYIWDNFYLASELKRMTNSPVRQDMALLHLANTLKMCAEKNNIAISTSIQLNGNEKIVDILDESCLFGSKQVKTKLDNGSILHEPRKKELEQAKPLIDKWNKKNGGIEYITPNRISHVFKARYNRYGMNLKVWHYLDTGTGRLIDMFITKHDNTPTDMVVKPLYITNN